jgi:nitrite reductase (NO-forming)
MFTYIYLYVTAGIIAVVSALVLLYALGVFGKVWRALREGGVMAFGGIIFLAVAGLMFYYAAHPHPMDFAMPPHTHTYAPSGPTADIPLISLFKFFEDTERFERVADIGRNPNEVPPPITRNNEELIKIDLTAKEVLAEVGHGVYFNYWTYNGQVPGPMLRVREGDTMELTLHNDKSSLHPHNIDLHSVTGPGGGASLTNVEPGETKSFRWKALAPGLYVYHCATPNVSTHNSHGQYGLILVEPKEGLPKVDKEFYVMQGELYTRDGLGVKGLVPFDAQALLDGIPTYITFNGKLEGAPRMEVTTGEKVRVYVGNGGVNLISSFHIIGEIFDTVYPEAAMGSGSSLFRNVQTTAVLPGGAAIVEFVAEVPGKLLLVDHALARMNKGAWAVMNVKGADRPDIFTAVKK